MRVTLCVSQSLVMFHKRIDMGDIYIYICLVTLANCCLTEETVVILEFHLVVTFPPLVFTTCTSRMWWLVDVASIPTLLHCYWTSWVGSERNGCTVFPEAEHFSVLIMRKKPSCLSLPLETNEKACFLKGQKIKTIIGMGLKLSPELRKPAELGDNCLCAHNFLFLFR